MVVLPPLGPFALVDLETTGLEFWKHDIVQIAALFGEITETRGTIYDEMNTLVIPNRIDLSEPEALEVNHYDPERWRKEAVSAGDALYELLFELEGCTFIGYNRGFDLGFLRHKTAVEGLEWVEPVKQYDVYYSVGKPLAKRLGCRGKLSVLCDELGIDVGDAHDALVDVKMSWVLMWRGLEIMYERKFDYDDFLSADA